jgi:hypothetical protein
MGTHIPCPACIERGEKAGFKAGQERKEIELASNPVCRFQDCMNGTLYCEKHSWKQARQDFAEEIKELIKDIQSDVFGDADTDTAYWNACEDILEALAKKAGQESKKIILLEKGMKEIIFEKELEQARKEGWQKALDATKKLNEEFRNSFNDLAQQEFVDKTSWDIAFRQKCFNGLFNWHKNKLEALRKGGDEGR